jgi:UPF0716 protein FxsA
MLVLLVALFVVVPLVELYVLIQVGQIIGVWWTLVLLVADSVLGGMLMRSQGRAAWRRFNEALAAGRVPAREAFDGVLVVLGGALLLAPGFVTDVVGALLLLPPTRAAIRRVLVRRFAARVGGPGSGGRGRPPWRRSGRDYDVEGTASELDPRALP